MLIDKIQKAFNEQLNFELYSSYIYMSMSGYFYSVNLPGFANWMKVQALEELTHAGKFFSFINDRGGKVLLQTIKGPATQWATPLAAFENALEHEQKVTTRINNLVDLALKEKDHASNIFLQWFVTEQVEEEANATEIIQKLKLIADHPASLFLVDQELAQRAFVMPPAQGASAAQ